MFQRKDLAQICPSASPEAWVISKEYEWAKYIESLRLHLVCVRIFSCRMLSFYHSDRFCKDWEWRSPQRCGGSEGLKGIHDKSSIWEMALVGIHQAFLNHRSMFHLIWDDLFSSQVFLFPLDPIQTKCSFLDQWPNDPIQIWSYPNQTNLRRLSGSSNAEGGGQGETCVSARAYLLKIVYWRGTTLH